MDQIRSLPAARTEIQYQAISKAILPPFCLMVITLCSMKVVADLTHKRIAPFQGQLPPTLFFIALSTVYIATFVHLAPSFTLQIKENPEEPPAPPQPMNPPPVPQQKPEEASVPAAQAEEKSSENQPEEPAEQRVILSSAELDESGSSVSSDLEGAHVSAHGDKEVDVFKSQYLAEIRMLISSIEAHLSLASEEASSSQAQPLGSQQQYLAMFLECLCKLEKEIQDKQVPVVCQPFIFNGMELEVRFDFSNLEKQLNTVQNLYRMYGVLIAQQPAEVSQSTLLNVKQEVSFEPNLVSADVKENKEDVEVLAVSASIQYDEARHGVNGIKMRKMLYKALHDEYIFLLGDIHRIKVQEVLQNLDTTSKAGLLLKETLDLLIKEDGTLYEACLEKHQELIEYYTENNCSEEIVRISRALSMVRMIPAIHSYQEELVAEHTTPSKELTAQNYHEVLLGRNREVQSAPKAMKMHNAMRKERMFAGEISLCNYFAVNPPNLLRLQRYEKDGQIRKIFKLRHGTPHVPKLKVSTEAIRSFLQTSGGDLENLNPIYWSLSNILSLGSIPFAMHQGPKINPIYEEFLRGTAEKGEGVLYAIHQLRGRKFEGYRVETIIELEKKHPNLLVLVQSVEDELFKEGAKTFAELKERLIAGFRQEYDASGNPIVKPNRLPKYLHGNQDYENTMREIFDFVHKTYFGGREEIDQTKYSMGIDKQWTAEWQACILLFHHYQREDLKFRDLLEGYPICYDNTACKDNYDRALQHNSTSARVHQTQIYGNDIPRQELDDLLTTSQAPPIQGKGKEIVDYRILPIALTSKVIAECSNIQAIQGRIDHGWKLVSSEVVRREGQHAIPAGSPLTDSFVLISE